MVAPRRTRLSAHTSTNDRSASPPPTHSSDPKVQRVIDRLKVNAHKALAGKTEQKSGSGRFYRWRGVTYEIDENTLPEWLEEDRKHREKEKEKGKGEGKGKKRGQSEEVDGEEDWGGGEEGEEGEYGKRYRCM
jgi:hypothetical protein